MYKWLFDPSSFKMHCNHWKMLTSQGNLSRSLTVRNHYLNYQSVRILQNSEAILENNTITHEAKAISLTESHEAAFGRESNLSDQLILLISTLITICPQKPEWDICRQNPPFLSLCKQLSAVECIYFVHNNNLLPQHPKHMRDLQFPNCKLVLAVAHPTCTDKTLNQFSICGRKYIMKNCQHVGFKCVIKM